MEKETEETISEEQEPPVEEGELEERISQLDSRAEELEGELDAERERSQEYLDTAKRVQADFDNFRKRQEKVRDEMVEFANERLIFELLTIMDDFERALDARDSEEEFREGVRRIHTSMISMLSSHGLREIPMTESFDPDLHEALCVEEGEIGRILEVYQKGYFLGNKVLRHSKVKVGKRMEEAD